MGIKVLASLIGKNLKIFFRSKVSSFAVILIPFLIIMFAGFAFNSSGLSNVNVAVYSESYSDFTNDIISGFQDSGFRHTKYDSSQSCIDSIKHSESQICVVFPANLSSDVSNDEIIFYADYSRVNLANNLIDEIEKTVLVKTSDVGENIAQGLIDSLEEIKASLPENKDKIDEALEEATKSKKSSSYLYVPTTELSAAIDDLENVKEDLENDSSLVSDVDEIILLLKSVKEDEEDLSSDIDSITDGQSNVVSKLNSASNNLNDLIVSLNSYKSVSANEVVSPIDTKIETISIDSNNRDYIVPIMLSLIALFGAILLSSTLVLKEKKTKAFFRNFMAPTRNVTFVISTYLTCLIIIFMQFIFIFAGAKYLLKIDLTPIIWPLAAILIISVLAFVGIGMFIGYLFRSDETTIFSSMIVAALLLFFSNIILPLENASGSFAKILKFNPLIVSNSALKKIILFDLGFNAILIDLAILGGFLLVFFILNCIFRSLTKRIL